MILSTFSAHLVPSEAGGNLIMLAANKENSSFFFSSSKISTESLSGDHQSTFHYKLADSELMLFVCLIFLSV